MVNKGEMCGAEGMNQELGMDTHTTVYKIDSHKDLLCSTGNSVIYDHLYEKRI